MAALFCSFTPVLDAEVLEAMRELSRHALAKPWTVLLFEAITAGFLMAAMVWMLPSAEGAQFPVVFLMTNLIAIAGAAHIVAGSIEAFVLLAAGAIGPWQAPAGSAVPTGPTPRNTERMGSAAASSRYRISAPPATACARSR